MKANGTVVTPNADGLYEICDIREAQVITIAQDPVGNESLTNGNKIWSNGRLVYVKTEKDATVRVHTATGGLYYQREVRAGETSFELPKGFYLVTLSDGTNAKVVIKP